MYRDFQREVNQQNIEKKLAQLECKVAWTINRICSAQEKGKSSAEITRPERDELRKFLIMKHRGSNQHRRLYNRDLDTYSANDKEEMVKYMRDKGFQKPIEVWYDNIEKLLSLEIDIADEWIDWLSDSIYPGDALWAIATLQQKYVAFCVPAKDCDEFILTENAYSIHEGPVSSSVNLRTGEEINRYTEYHNFAPISPKLMIVLRSTLLPNPVEDAIPGMRQKRELRRMAEMMQHSEYDMTGSFLEHLPVTKARASYIRMINGMPMLAEGEDGSRRADHRFEFPFFSVSSDYVQKINAVMLNESHTVSTIAFASPRGARRALEYYLTSGCEEKGAYPLKIVSAPEDPKLCHLKVLEQAAKLFGSDASAKFHVDYRDFGARLPMVPESLEALEETTAERGVGRDAAAGGIIETTSQSPDHMFSSEPVKAWGQRYHPQEFAVPINEDRSSRPAEEKRARAEETVEHQIHQPPSTSNEDERIGQRPEESSEASERRRMEEADAQRLQFLVIFFAIPIIAIFCLFNFVIFPRFYILYLQGSKLLEELRKPDAASQTDPPPEEPVDALECSDGSKKEPHNKEGDTNDSLIFILSLLVTCITVFALFLVGMRAYISLCEFVVGQIYQALTSFVARYGGWGLL